MSSFTGKERDSETGLDWFETRYLSSEQGRFTSPDSFDNGGAVRTGRRIGCGFDRADDADGDVRQLDSPDQRGDRVGGGEFVLIGNCVCAERQCDFAEDGHLGVLHREQLYRLFHVRFGEPAEDDEGVLGRWMRGNAELRADLHLRRGGELGCGNEQRSGDAEPCYAGGDN